MGEVIAVFIEGGNRQQVVLIRQVDDMDQGNGGGVLDSGIRVEGELLGDKAADVGDVGVQLQAAHIATGAPGSNKVDSGMADFSTLPPVAMVQVVVEHQTGADAVLQVDIQEVGDFFSAAVHLFTQGAGVTVVDEKGRQAGVLFHLPDNGKVLYPPKIGRVQQNAGGGVQGADAGDAHRQKGTAGALPQGVHTGKEDAQQVFGILQLGGALGDAVQDVSGQVPQHHLVQASFDKDADDFGGAGREGQGCGDAAVGGLPGGGALLLGDNPQLQQLRDDVRHRHFGKVGDFRQVDAGKPRLGGDKFQKKQEVFLLQSLDADTDVAGHGTTSL